MTITHSDDDLFHALASRARSTSDGRLVLAVVLGLATTLVIALWRPPAWLILGCVGIGAAAFGAWGIADRELAERSATRDVSVVMLRGVRILSIVIGCGAAIVAALRVLASALGTWIS
ncbi:MAG TPA: hypothetical protein VKA54_18115 [Gemmatimonadaceae bacterium]|nr:hypothetical protein [Gemmatimonadaceae bacterium]